MAHEEVPQIVKDFAKFLTWRKLWDDINNFLKDVSVNAMPKRIRDDAEKLLKEINEDSPEE